MSRHRLDPKYYEDIDMPEEEEQNDPEVLRDMIQQMNAYIDQLHEQMREIKREWKNKEIELNTQIIEHRDIQDRFHLLQQQVMITSKANDELILENSGLKKSLSINGKEIQVMQNKIDNMMYEMEDSYRQKEAKLFEKHTKYAEAGIQIDEGETEQVWVYDEKLKKSVKATDGKRPYTDRILTMAETDRLLYEYGELTEFIIPSHKKKIKLLAEIKAENEKEKEELAKAFAELKQKILDNDTTHKEEIEKKDQEISNKLIDVNNLSKDITRLDAYVGQLQAEITQWKACVVRYEDVYNPDHEWNEKVNTYHEDLKKIQLENQKIKEENYKKLWFFQKWFKKK